MNQDQYNKINNICLLIIAAVALTSALIYTKSALIPLIIALFIYAVAAPILYWLQTRLKVPHFASILITAALFLILSGFTIIIIVNSIESFFQSAEIYNQKIQQAILDFSAYLKTYDIEINSQVLVERLKTQPVFNILKSMTGGVINFVGNFFIIVLIVLFLITSRGTTKKSQNELIRTMQEKITRYISAKLVISLITALLIFLLLFTVGVELAFMFALLTFLLNFIPNIGSLIASAAPVPVVLLQFGVGVKLILVIAVSTLIQVIMGNLVEPKIMGENLDLHPVTILVALIFWGLVWGIPGMFLAAPITAIIKIILSRIENTKTISELMAGRVGSLRS